MSKHVTSCDVSPYDTAYIALHTLHTLHHVRLRLVRLYRSRLGNVMKCHEKSGNQDRQIKSELIRP